MSSRSKQVSPRGNTARFTFDGRSIEVVEVRYFKVRGDDGAYHILRNEVMTGRWELTMFDRTGAIRRKR